MEIKKLILEIQELIEKKESTAEIELKIDKIILKKLKSFMAIEKMLIS